MSSFDPSNHIFQTAASFINQTNKHLFLTGKAGTGKTTFLKYIKEHSLKKMAVVAPTGVAAINAGGVTIHSLFQVPPGTYLPSGTNTLEPFGKIYNNHSLFRQMRMSSDKKELLRELDLLIIDEISMVRADLLDAVDAVLRYIRNRPHVPFGGVQVLYIGDLFQLPPVVIKEEWEILKDFYRSPFFFDAQVIAQAPPVYIELKKIYRQSDEIFINILNNIRNNCCTEKDLLHLQNYYKPGFSPSPGENFITLTTHNEKAAAINDHEVKKLPGKFYQFKAAVSGEFNERSFPAEESLHLKKNAQVMLIKNDTGELRRYYNGKIGTIHSIDENEIQIIFPGEKEILKLEKETWKNIRYHYSKEKDRIDEEELGTFKQYPLRLAWAITIHKSQGLTFNKAVVDAGASFAAGQVYVALSRLTSLEGLVLKSRIYPGSIYTDERVIEFVCKELPEDELKQTLRKEQQSYVRYSLLNGFGWEKISDVLQKHLEEYELRSLADADTCIAWAEKMVERTKTLEETAAKFQKQLEQLFDQSGQDNYHLIHERVSAACAYFIRKTDEDLLQLLHDHIEIMRVKSKTKKYVKELFGLEEQLDRKKSQLINMMNVSEAMRRAGSHDDVLRAIEDLQKPIIAQPGEENNKRKKPEKGETQRISLALFKKGKNIPEIAMERNLAHSTIEGHLAGFVSTGELDILDIVDKITFEKISELIEKNPAFGATEIKYRLGNDFSYGQVKAVINSKMLPRSSSGEF
ncbi:MAG TPA: helix-turn-helix domain-containing protein [Chitinophagaceae bacterium]|nr:helix-turn-helix domain-containing protein [Chitinophagaceae bacterium]